MSHGARYLAELAAGAGGGGLRDPRPPARLLPAPARSRRAGLCAGLGAGRGGAGAAHWPGWGGRGLQGGAGPEGWGQRRSLAMEGLAGRGWRGGAGPAGPGPLTGRGGAGSTPMIGQSRAGRGWRRSLAWAPPSLVPAGPPLFPLTAWLLDLPVRPRPPCEDRPHLSALTSPDPALSAQSFPFSNCSRLPPSPAFITCAQVLLLRISFIHPSLYPFLHFPLLYHPFLISFLFPAPSPHSNPQTPRKAWISSFPDRTSSLTRGAASQASIQPGALALPPKTLQRQTCPAPCQGLNFRLTLRPVSSL